MNRIIRAAVVACAILIVAASVCAAYKAKPWTIRSVESYTCKLTSEGVTIAVEPLFKDALAARVFDKNDMVTRGIMPLAIIIFNDNDFPVLVDSATVEVILGDDHEHSLAPRDVARYFVSKSVKSALNRGSSGPRLDQTALDDYEAKFLGKKTVAAHATAGGFLYLHLGEAKDLSELVSRSRAYIPGVYRQDTGSRMIYYEIDLKPAVEAAIAK